MVLAKIFKCQPRNEILGKIMEKQIIEKPKSLTESINYELPRTFLRKVLRHRKLFYILGSVDDALRYTSLYGHAKKINIIAGELFPYYYNNPNLLKNLEAS